MLTKHDQELIEEETSNIGYYLRREAGPGMNKFSEITPHIFISDWDGAANGDNLRDNDIELIICVSKERKSKTTTNLYESLRINQIVIPIADNPQENLSMHFENFYEIVHNALLEERTILVHCQYGTSVSAALVLFYLLKRYYITNFGKKETRDMELIGPVFKLQNIIEFVKERRPCVEPNPGFIAQILTAEMFLKKKLTAIYQAREQAARKARRHRDIEEAEKRETRRKAKTKKKVKFSDPLVSYIE